MKAPLRPLKIMLLFVPAAACLGLFVWLRALPPSERVIAAYSTSIARRVPSQIHNARLALTALDGAVIPAGEEFSFNRTVGPWSADRGYLKAPVSYSGERVLDWGGGVCQVSTTLYNAALLAGLAVAERHPHHWPAPYAPIGQDAAVAYPGVDLRLRNTFKVPVRISARVMGESLVIKLHSRAQAPSVSVTQEIISVTRPASVLYFRPHYSGRPPVMGEPGFEVLVYRNFAGKTERRELVSRDSYPQRNEIIWQ